MCCRISTTGFATRTIAGLYIFLATFLIGFFAVRATRWIDRSWFESADFVLPPPTVQGIDNNVVLKNEENPLLIKYDCSLMGRERLDAGFSLTNVGSEPITFDTTLEGIIVALQFPSGITIRPFGEVPVQQLDPGKSTGLIVFVPEKSNSFDLSIHYHYGARYVEVEKDQWVHVLNQRKSFTCSL
jgi:hypothetical protein